MSSLIVGIGGFLGSILRYWVGLIPFNKGGSLFPWPTFIVNILGALFIALVVEWGGKHFGWSANTILFLKTGVCGGFSTFSSFALETNALFNNGHIALALFYIGLTMVGGLLAVFLVQLSA